MSISIRHAAMRRARLPRRADATSNVLAPIAGVALILAIWTIGGRAGWASGMIVTPVDAVRPIFGESRDVYQRATVATVSAALRGLAIGSALAFAAAVLAASLPSLRGTVTRLAAITNAAPWVAVAPALLVILGRDRGPVAVAAIAVFFFIFVSTSVGLNAAPASMHDVARALGASRVRRVWSLQLPSALPSIADGFRLAVPASLAGAIFGEWYGARRGLGILLITSMQAGNPQRLWAASLLAAGCGLVAFAVLAAARGRLARRYGGAIGQAGPEAPPARSPLRRMVIELLTVVGLASTFVAAWWMWIELADVSPLVIPRPSAVWAELSGSPGFYASASSSTLETAAVALVAGSCIGLAAALAASRVRVLAGATIPLVALLAATPLLALFPLLARIFGYQPGTVRVLAIVTVFYPVFVYTRSGFFAASRSTLDVVDALGGSRGARFRLVELPAAVPHIVSGFRVAAGSAVIASVVGETLIGRTGLGVEFSYSYRLLQLPRAFGAAVVIVVVSVIVFALAGKLERTVHARRI